MILKSNNIILLIITVSFRLVNKLRLISHPPDNHSISDRLTHINEHEWIDSAIERLGLYVSSKWDNLYAFFKDYSNGQIMSLDDFKKFTKDNYTCFEGFNLSDEELTTLYVSLDVSNKSYVSLDDIEAKISNFNYNKI